MRMLTALVIFFRTFAMSALKTALLLGGTGATGKHVFEELKASEKIGKVIFLSRRDIQADADNSKVSCVLLLFHIRGSIKCIEVFDRQRHNMFLYLHFR